MFEGCSKLQSINFGDRWSTSGVYYMSSMFAGCSTLTGLDLSKWDTSKVKHMTSMFN